MAAYFNEIDPYAAQWLRNLIAAGHIAPGDVDERSIEDVRPDDLRGYTQCHFFAGIGVWSSALRLAGWPDDRSVWTGSCPCQPFSAAGKGLGFADERHLWPAWHHLISECRPSVIFGEQVASKDVDPWIDLVFDDLEALEYACAANPFPSAGVGAPHIRDRTFFVAHAYDARSQGRRGVRERSTELVARTRRVAGVVADAERGAAERQRLDMGSAASGMRSSPRQQRIRDDARHGGDARKLAHSDSSRRPQRGEGCAPMGHGAPAESDRSTCRLADSDGRNAGAHPGIHRREEGSGPRDGESERCGSVSDRAGPTNGFWGATDWLLCRDGKWRPVEPGYEQMADGSARSLGRVCAADIEEITEEVNEWSNRHQADAGEALRAVWQDLRAQALCEREAGRFSGVQSPSILLAFLRQLTEQGWRFEHALACAREKASEIVVRVMRFDASAARTPLRRELAQQLDGQPANALQELSSIVASNAARCWGEACRAKAGAASFPLATDAPARVGRLRAYGNAINREAAATFIAAANEAMTA